MLGRLDRPDLAPVLDPRTNERERAQELLLGHVERTLEARALREERRFDLDPAKVDVVRREVGVEFLSEDGTLAVTGERGKKDQRRRTAVETEATRRTPRERRARHEA